MWLIKLIKFLWRVFIKWRVFEAGVALFCLLVTHQIVWVLFQDLRWSLRFPSVWLTPMDQTDPALLSPEPIKVTEPHIDLRGFAPPTREVILTVNDVLVASAFSFRSGQLSFFAVPVRRGLNKITAHLRGEPEERAFAPGEESNSLRVLYRATTLLQPKFLGLFAGEGEEAIAIGLAEPSSTIFIRQATQRDPVEIETNSVGAFQYRFPFKRWEEVEIRAAASKEDFQAGREDVPKVRAVAGQPEAESTTILARKISISLTKDSGYKIDFRLKIPPDTALHEWVRQNLISPRDLMESVFGLLTIPYPSWVWNPLASTDAKLSLTEDSIVLETRGEIPPEGLHLWLLGGSIPPLISPCDEIRLETTDVSRVVFYLPPDQVDDSVRIWRGGYHDDRYNKYLLTIRGSSETVAGIPKRVAPKPENLVDSLKQLQRKVPEKLNPILLALLTAIPFIWLLWIIRSSSDAVGSGYRDTLSAVAVTFLIFHLTILSLPVFSSSFDFLHHLIAPNLINPILDIVLRTVQDVGWIYPFLAIGVSLLLRPIYHAYERRQPAPTLRRWIRWLIFWPAALVIPPVFFFGLVLVKSKYRIFEPDVQLLFLLLGAVFVILGMLFFWFFLYWLIRVILGRSIRIRSAIEVSWAMLLFPIVPPLLESAARFARFIIVTKTRISPFFIPLHLDNFAWLLIISGVGVWLLFQVTYLSIRLSQHQPSFRFFHSGFSWGLLALLAVFFIVSLPMDYVLGALQQSYVNVRDLMDLAYNIDNLLPYALLIGLLVFLRQLNREDQFDLPVDARRVGVLLFAFYLTGRTTNLLFIPIPLLLGWYIFKHWALTAQLPVNPITESPPLRVLIRRLLDYKQALRLVPGLQRSLEKKYTQGDIALTELRRKVEESERYLDKAEDALPIGPAATKYRIFGRGPESGPWANARVAVFYGLFLSVPFQISNLIKIFEGKAFGNYPLLQVTEALLSSASWWILIAFLFGYFFHLIRGRSGFEKAFVYIAALIIPTIPQRLIEAQPLLNQSYLAQIVQIVAYVLLLALIAFDLRILQKVGYTWRELLSVHGLITITAYGSSIAIATAASLTGKDIIPFAWKFINWLFGGQL